MVELNLSQILGEWNGKLAGLDHIHMAIVYQILFRRGLTTREEVIELAELHRDAATDEFIKAQMQLVVDAFREGRGPIFTVIDGGKDGT